MLETARKAASAASDEATAEQAAAVVAAMAHLSEEGQARIAVDAIEALVLKMNHLSLRSDTARPEGTGQKEDGSGNADNEAVDTYVDRHRRFRGSQKSG